MPLLAAFMEFLLNTLQYGAVTDPAASLSGLRLSWRGLQDTANALLQAVYAWLREHTRPVRESRDFKVIAAVPCRTRRRRRGGAGVLAHGFRRARSEFRTYRKTFWSFLRFAEALREASFREGPENLEPLDAERTAPAGFEGGVAA